MNEEIEEKFNSKKENKNNENFGSNIKIVKSNLSPFLTSYSFSGSLSPICRSQSQGKISKKLRKV